MTLYRQTEAERQGREAALAAIRDGVTSRNPYNAHTKKGRAWRWAYDRAKPLAEQIMRIGAP